MKINIAKCGGYGQGAIHTSKNKSRKKHKFFINVRNVRAAGSPLETKNERPPP